MTGEVFCERVGIVKVHDEALGANHLGRSTHPKHATLPRFRNKRPVLPPNELFRRLAATPEPLPILRDSL